MKIYPLLFGILHFLGSHGHFLFRPSIHDADLSRPQAQARSRAVDCCVTSTDDRYAITYIYIPAEVEISEEDVFPL